VLFIHGASLHSVSICQGFLFRLEGSAWFAIRETAREASLPIPPWGVRIFRRLIETAATEEDVAAPIVGAVITAESIEGHRWAEKLQKRH